MTSAELNAYASIPRIAGALVEISKLLKAIASIEYTNTIDCTGLCGRTHRAIVLERVRKDLGIETSA